jgi:hypothetical protein
MEKEKDKPLTVGSLVEITQVRGAGSYKHVIPRGLGVVVRVEETEPMMYGTVGPIDFGPIVHVLLTTGKTEGFDLKSVKVVA